jgi:hypothetical protein
MSLEVIIKNALLANFAIGNTLPPETKSKTVALAALSAMGTPALTSVMIAKEKTNDEQKIGVLSEQIRIRTNNSIEFAQMNSKINETLNQNINPILTEDDVKNFLMAVFTEEQLRRFKKVATGKASNIISSIVGEDQQLNSPALISLARTMARAFSEFSALPTEDSQPKEPKEPTELKQPKQ